jgi:hypothetical protein
MFENIYNVFVNAIKITGFIFVMMLVIEYVNVQSRGIWEKSLTGNKWKQYLFAGILGAIPGCLGAFVMVTLFSHRLVSFGALVATMIATSGDEAYVMFAMFPRQAILLTAIIFAIGILAGYITDKVYVPTRILERFTERNLPLHDEPQCKCFDKEKLFQYVFRPSIYRLALTIIILLLFIAVATGILASGAKLWMKITILFTLGFSYFVVVSVPEHFLKKHLWDHIVKMHIPRIFLWTFGTLLVIHFLMNYIDIQAWLSDNMFVVLLIAILIGIIPESGPHLVFVTLFAQGSIPFSILMASSIAQDGHGMLPLLAESKQGFFAVKIVNMLYALIFGIIGFLAGF